MPPIQDGQFTKQSVADFFGWNDVPDVPQEFTARAYYNSDDDTFHVINSNGDELLLTSGTGMSLFPTADQVVAGTYGLIFSPGGYVQVSPISFADLPPASSSLEGVFMPVLDSNTATWGATITGTGANHVLAYCNGSVWSVQAK